MTNPGVQEESAKKNTRDVSRQGGGHGSMDGRLAPPSPTNRTPHTHQSNLRSQSSRALRSPGPCAPSPGQCWVAERGCPARYLLPCGPLPGSTCRAGRRRPRQRRPETLPRRVSYKFAAEPSTSHRLTTAGRLPLQRVLDLPPVVRFLRAYGRPVVARVELDTEQMTPKKWKSCRAHRHHQPCRRSG